MATTEPRKSSPTAAWRDELYGATPERQGELFSTISGIENDPLYTPDAGGVDYERDLGYPGAYPFTRGVYPSMYRGRLWTMRRFAGFGTAEETNERFRYLLDHGQTGLSTAFDMPSLMGYDSDHPRSEGEVGREGVAIEMAFYVVAAEQSGVPADRLGGTIQADILKEYIAQKEWCFPVDPAMRLLGDMVEWCTREMPRWYPISISGYHI